MGARAEARELLAAADALLPYAAHLLTDDDRIDRRQAASIMSDPASKVSPPGGIPDAGAGSVAGWAADSF